MFLGPKSVDGGVDIISDSVDKNVAPFVPTLSYSTLQNGLRSPIANSYSGFCLSFTDITNSVLLPRQESELVAKVLVHCIAYTRKLR